MEIEINGQKKEIKEIKYLDTVEIEEIRQNQGLRAATKKYLILSGFTDEEAENLSLKDGVKIQKDLEKFSKDFQNPTKELEQN